MSNNKRKKAYLTTFPSQFKKYKFILETSIKYQIKIYAWLEAEGNEAKEMN